MYKYTLPKHKLYIFNKAFKYIYVRKRVQFKMHTYWKTNTCKCVLWRIKIKNLFITCCLCFIFTISRRNLVVTFLRFAHIVEQNRVSLSLNMSKWAKNIRLHLTSYNTIFMYAFA